MKRFITYLYAYKDGQKMKNTGHIRVDVKSQVLDMQINIKDAELDYAKGTFYIILRRKGINKIPLVDILVRDGLFCGNVRYKYDMKNEFGCGFETIIGVGIDYENGGYMASCWKDGEEEAIANSEFEVSDAAEKEEIAIACEDVEDIGTIEASSIMEERRIIKENSEIEESHAIKENNQIEEWDKIKGNMRAASVDVIEDFHKKIEPNYRKINLNEIYMLPSHAWHFSNNSFLLHGFWNYGYLVLKEIMEENEKRIALGVPGIFEQPEMVMAAYFGFPEFETLPPQAMEIKIGERFNYSLEVKKQQPEAGAMGCWFVNL